MDRRPSYWFPVKRYGWGWGLPVRWQGWAVLGGYVASLLGGFFYFDPRAGISAFLAYAGAVMVIVIAVVAAKGEQPVRWRWGKG
jgi:hypothetical protein